MSARKTRFLYLWFLLYTFGVWTKVYAQSDTVYKTGYIIYKLENARLPLQFAFVEKRVGQDDHAKSLAEIFDPKTDTAALLPLVFINQTAKLKLNKLIEYKFGEEMFTIFTMKEDGGQTLQTHRFNMIPGVLKIIIPEVSFSGVDGYIVKMPFVNKDGKIVLNFSRHDFTGYVDSFYRYFFYRNS